MRCFTGMILTLFVSLVSNSQPSSFQWPGYLIADSAESEEIRTGVMSTGDYDHCSFSQPRWMTKKWSDKRHKDKGGRITRQRKWVIRITSPEGERCTLVYGWALSKWDPQTAKWYFAGIREDGRTEQTVDCKTGKKQ